MPEQSVINWANETTDVSFFVAMVGYKPVGVGKHFQMLLIHDKFCRLINKEIPTRVLWDRLDEMYDLEALDTSEISPFPNSRTRDFELPDDEFGELIAAKKNSAGSGSEDDDEEEDSEEDLELEADSKPKDGASARPAATGGKTGKGDWTPAKASPVPTALAKANKHKGNVDCVQEATPSPASSTKSSTPAPETTSEKRPGTSSGGKDKEGKAVGAEGDKKDNHQQQVRRSTAKDSKVKDVGKDEKDTQQKKETSTSARRTGDSKAGKGTNKDDEPKSTKRVSDVRKDHIDRRSRASSATEQDSKDSNKDNVGSKDNTGSNNGGNASSKGEATGSLPASKTGAKGRRESRRPDSLSGRREPMRRRSRSRNVSPAASTGSKRNASPATNPGRRNSSPSTTSTKRTASPAQPASKAAASPAATASASRKRATRSEVSSPANAKRARAR